MAESVSLRDLQRSLIEYLQYGGYAAEDLVAEQAPISARARLSIYGSAYMIRLCQTLENDHEMLAWYLGDEQFAQLAASYIHQHPSHYTSLRDFGNALPEFLRQTDPYRDLPVLSELAAFERMMLDVFDAPDADRAGLPELQSRPADTWPRMRVRFHPSVQLYATRTNAVPIWQALKAAQTPPGPATDQPSDWLLWRGADRLSQFRSLTAIEQRLLDAAIAGADFATLCECLLRDLPEAKISEVVLTQVVNWLDQGLVRNFD